MALTSTIFLHPPLFVRIPDENDESRFPCISIEDYESIARNIFLE
jgi:hypothetical protein